MSSGWRCSVEPREALIKRFVYLVYFLVKHFKRRHVAGLTRPDLFVASNTC